MDVPGSFDLGAAVFADGREGTDLAGQRVVLGHAVAAAEPDAKLGREVLVMRFGIAAERQEEPLAVRVGAVLDQDVLRADALGAEHLREAPGLQGLQQLAGIVAHGRRALVELAKLRAPALLGVEVFRAGALGEDRAARAATGTIRDLAFSSTLNLSEISGDEPARTKLDFNFSL